MYYKRGNYIFKDGYRQLKEVLEGTCERDIWRSSSDRMCIGLLWEHHMEAIRRYRAFGFSKVCFEKLQGKENAIAGYVGLLLLVMVIDL